MKKKNILFTGGGTAGHVIVNLALIPSFQKDGWNIDYIGSYEGIERKLISELEGVTYHSISTGKLRRYMSMENVKDPFKVIKGVFQAWRIIKKQKPAVVFSKGGFVSVPVVIAAKLCRIPTIIHESDYTPGLANKIASRFAQQVLTTFPETVNYLPENKAIPIGAVIREELFQGNEEIGLTLTGLTKEKPILLIMGGSGGSRTINTLITDNLEEILTEFQIIHICGLGNVNRSATRKGYVQFEYVNEELKDILAITDYVISRAGSNAIFEFLALRIPMLLIPLSLAASRGDQIVNAKSFKESGYAHVLDEEKLTKETLLRSIHRLKKSGPVLIDKMEKFESKAVRENVIDIIKNTSKHV
ncbi:undecaprenyldiphospho-muramoylpentapeptide beta-N-acetylglucosaminyltransferase [Virgibacillus sp. W0430]|uniref:undecaprenyldiphospho-muramoylpentapeptide beta-N-acetylglucosaminyltransferase n=1 Tax=Virgibacillus sp. W0430 TaxID=3391580 RepID=UPI003F45977E